MSEPAREIEYATKADVDALRGEIRSDLDILRSELRAEIARAETRQTWRLLGGFTVLLTLFRLLDLLPVG